jgi:hypothetical protein
MITPKSIRVCAGIVAVVAFEVSLRHFGPYPQRNAYLISFAIGVLVLIVLGLVARYWEERSR